MDDYFAVQSMIIDRLKERVDGLREVRGAGNGPREVGRATPLLLVAFHAETLLDSPGAKVRGEQLVVQSWRLELITHATRDVKEGGGNRELAGPLLARINQALLGWKPGAGYSPLERAAAPGAEYKDGFGHFFQIFHTRVVIRGDID